MAADLPASTLSPILNPHIADAIKHLRDAMAHLDKAGHCSEDEWSRVCDAEWTAFKAVVEAPALNDAELVQKLLVCFTMEVKRHGIEPEMGEELRSFAVAVSDYFGKSA